MEDFYPFRNEDIPELFPHGKTNFAMKSWELDWGDKTPLTFLLPLVIDLLDDVEMIRALKNTFVVEYGGNSGAKNSDGFLKIVKAYLEENNGTRDMSPITELMKSYGHLVFAKELEGFFLQYSLPAPSKAKGSEDPSMNLSADSLQSEQKSMTGSSEYFWNNNSLEQASQNSAQLEGLFAKLRMSMLSRHLQQYSFNADDWFRKDRKEKAMSLLLPLVIDLLGDVGRSRAWKNSFQKEFGDNLYTEINDGFFKIVKAYLEENGGTGNLLKLAEVLSSNGHLLDADCLEKFFLRYSLPACSKGSENANTYSLSRDFLQVVEESIARNSVSVGNANSVEQALQNSVILEELFKKLQLRDQKLFRLVSSTWMEETMSFWRRNARILIHVLPAEKDLFPRGVGVSLAKFMDLWEISKKITEEEANAKAKAKQQLEDHPFHSIHLWYSYPINPFSTGETEDKFWRLCGPHIRDLKITNSSNTWLNTTILCKDILQVICQNLKQLEIASWSDWKMIPDYCSSSEEVNDVGRKENDGNPATLVQVKKTKIAKNLHTLRLRRISAEALRSILFICPNLKELRLCAVQGTIVALPSPTSNGEFIKLKKLVIWEFYNTIDDFLILRQYSEMLAKNRFDSLEHLQLQTPLSNARSAPFNLYAALALASKNLKTLELVLIISEDYNSNENLDWFMDLSPFAFPNLTKLNLIIDFDVEVPFGLDFDFGTLKGMPMLEKLEINAKNVHREVVRKDGTRDWVFEGDRNRYLPTGVTVDYQYSAEDPILCSNLKEFKFHHDWSLNEEDVRLLSSWFPNLTLLEAGVNSEALPLLVKNWQRLEKLVIHTEKLISLRKLRPLKEVKKNIQIFQRFFIDGMVPDNDDEPGVELKEQNGRLFFSI